MTQRLYTELGEMTNEINAGTQLRFDSYKHVQSIIAKTFTLQKARSFFLYFIKYSLYRKTVKTNVISLI